MDDKVYEQAANVARLPGIVKASYAMPDAHWGYGFPIGGVAAFDPGEGGVVSAGGVGFDISCGVRTMLTGLTARDLRPVQKDLADQLYRDIPAGVGAYKDVGAMVEARPSTRASPGGSPWSGRSSASRAERGGRARRLTRVLAGGPGPGAAVF